MWLPCLLTNVVLTQQWQSLLGQGEQLVKGTQREKELREQREKEERERKERERKEKQDEQEGEFLS